MLINLCNALMAGKRMPYIESSQLRNQYVDTGLVGRTDYDFSIKFVPFFAIPGSGSGFSWINTVFGYEDWRDSGAAGRFEITNWPAFSGGSFFVGGVDSNPKMVQNELCEMSLRGNIFTTSDGLSTTINRRTYTAPHGAPIYLFANNLYHNDYRNQAGRYGWLRFYEMQIWNASGTLLRHFVPKKTSPTTGILHDLVNGVDYPNKGVGEFIYGEE